MSECVVRMEMPSKDKVCGVVFDFCGVWYCPVKKRICHQPDNMEIPSWCPIVCAIPEGHGRPGDLDELKNWLVAQIEHYKRFDYGAICSTMVSAYETVCKVIDSMTVIGPTEAERSET